MQDRNKKGRTTSGEALPQSKVTEADVVAIRMSSDSGRVLAKRYGISFQTVSEIRLRKIWKHIA